MSDAEACVLLAEYLAAYAGHAAVGARLSKEYEWVAPDVFWSDEDRSEYEESRDKAMEIWKKLMPDKLKLVKAVELILNDLRDGDLPS